MSRIEGEGSAHIRVQFDSRVFHLATIKKAAYRFIDKFSTDFCYEGHEIRCLLRFKSSLDQALHALLVEDFRKEVLDQDLREQIRAETEPIRNLIFAHAFSKTGVVGDEQISRT